MKRIFTKSVVSRLSLAGVFMLLVTTLTGCSDWEPGPGPGYGTSFYDGALTGCWELVEINGSYVSASQTNFLQFYGNGRGQYCYYYNGIPRRETMSYWCQDSYNSFSNYEVNISYGSGMPSTMNYWFSTGGSYLYLRWATNSGIVTYVYQYISRLPYPF